MKILLFDVDGTLIRAGGAGRKALNRAVLSLYGKKNVCGESSLAGRTDRWNFKAAHRIATGRDPTGPEFERLHQEYLRFLPGYVQKAMKNGTYVLPRGIKALLRRLGREKGLLLGLGTGNMERGARIKLEPSGFNAYFLFGGFGSDGFHRPTLLRKAVQRARRWTREPIAASDVFVVGDTPFDVRAGRKAGYRTIAVGTGFAEWRDLVAARPDHLARDFRGIRRWLDWLNRKPCEGGRSLTPRRPAN